MGFFLVNISKIIMIINTKALGGLFYSKKQETSLKYQKGALLSSGTKMQRKKTSIVLDLQDWKKLKKIAVDCCCSLNHLLNLAVKNYLEGP